MSVVYLSGPISLGGAIGTKEQRKFVEVFTFEAARLREYGYEIINPCECPTESSWEAYMRHGMRAVANCDMVGVLPRWLESRGALLEVFVARELGIPVHEAYEIGRSI